MVNYNAIKNSVNEGAAAGIKGHIYKLINKHDDLVYIGSTEIGLHLRFEVHKQYSKNSETKLYKHMRNIGVENFSIQLLEEIKMCNPKSLKEIEGEYIKKYDSINNGLNTYMSNSIAVSSSSDKKTYMREYMKNYWKSEKGAQYAQEYKEKKRENERKRREKIKKASLASQPEIQPI